MTKVYISGPMTGIEDYNKPAFMKAAETLRAQGYEVVNPAEIAQEVSKVLKDPQWTDYMRADLKALCGCDRVAMLDGYENSKGAMIEISLAVELGLELVELIVAEA